MPREKSQQWASDCTGYHSALHVTRDNTWHVPAWQLSAITGAGEGVITRPGAHQGLDHPHQDMMIRMSRSWIQILPPLWTLIREPMTQPIGMQHGPGLTNPLSPLSDPWSQTLDPGVHVHHGESVIRTQTPDVWLRLSQGPGVESGESAAIYTETVRHQPHLAPGKLTRRAGHKNDAGRLRDTKISSTFWNSDKEKQRDKV